MTHKERFLTAINHQEPDRVPICVWYTPEAEMKMLRHLGVDSTRTETYKAAGGPLPILMDHDFLISWVGPCTGYYARPDREYTDEWGIGWKLFENPTGAYTEMVRHPLAVICSWHSIEIFASDGVTRFFLPEGIQRFVLWLNRDPKQQKEQLQKEIEAAKKKP